MKVKLWGVRGSLPTPQFPKTIEYRIETLILECLNRGIKDATGVRRFLSSLPPDEFAGFGGNSSCVEVFTNSHSLIIDAGTGIRPLGQIVNSKEIHILFTHFHWDHIIGLGFFAPIFSPNYTIHFYAVQPELEAAVKMVFTKPFFPVAFKDLGAKIHFHQLTPRKSHAIQGFDVTPYELDHPDACWGYRIVHEGRVFSYCVDHECSRASRVQMGPDLPLYQGVDVMVFDAQYTLVELADRTNWGHSAAPIGLDVAMREGIKRVYFAHHEPNSSDQDIAAAEQMTWDYYRTRMNQADAAKYHEVDFKFAVEGSIIEI